MEKETRKPEHVCNTFDCTETSLCLFTFSEGVSHFYDIEIFVSLPYNANYFLFMIPFDIVHVLYCITTTEKNRKENKSTLVFVCAPRKQVHCACLSQ